MRRYILLLALVSAYTGETCAQNDATFAEFKKTYLTYPFSDPDPIPSSKKIYPYFRFDGFSNQPVEREWKVVLLENDYISVQIMPEIGGKIWTATEKRTGKDFLYNNGVVKFRDIAMRGPWVSGGIEINYGVIGHTPNTATPVDYLVSNNSDGSVSCFVSTFDLLTRTRWLVEVKLEKDKAFFTTRSFWFNGSGVEQPYYTWMNGAIPEGKSLRFLYPGTHSIGHGGEARQWPRDDSGRDLSQYEQNAFGGSKSYHIVGTHTNYFGALWEKDDFGMIRYANREDKLGKKIFLWSLSGSGRIWEELLTDNSGQYVEIQSGRLFNQNQFQSSFTPFKQIGFSPGNSDNWTEHWYPFAGLGGFTAANLVGAFHITRDGGQLHVRLSPVQVVEDSLTVFDQENVPIAKAWLQAKPLEPVEVTLQIPRDKTPSRILVKNEALNLDEQRLQRPTQIDSLFDAEGAYGLYLQGRDLSQLRQYENAETKINASLNKDPLLLPALVEMAKLKLFRMQYDSAFYFAKQALAIDTYDGAANYYYGKAAQKLGFHYDAVDGFEVATLTAEYRSVAYTGLADIYIRRKDLSKAKAYAHKSLLNNSQNLHSLQLLYLIAREEKHKEAMEDLAGKIEELDPLNHFLRFETYLAEPSEQHKQQFVGVIRNEMPIETYLELAAQYVSWGRIQESKKLLSLAPPNTEVSFWKAWLNKDDPALSQRYLEEAEASSPYFVFPFREESAAVFTWALSKSSDWRPAYLLGLIEDFHGNKDRAIEHLEAHDKVDFAPFYMLRARLRPEEAKKLRLEDVERAVGIDPDQWRYKLIQAKLLTQMDQRPEAIKILQAAQQQHQDNYIVGLELVRQLVKSDRYREADELLVGLNVLPFEGATDARRYYRQIKLMLAQEALDQRDYKRALARVSEALEWPAHLGVGKPFEADINNDLEHWMQYLILSRSGKQAAAKRAWANIDNKALHEDNYLEMIRSISGNLDQRIF